MSSSVEDLRSTYVALRQSRASRPGTALTGGGTGHGPHDGKEEIRFFQTGAFTYMVREPEIVDVDAKTSGLAKLSPAERAALGIRV